MERKRSTSNTRLEPKTLILSHVEEIKIKIIYIICKIKESLNANVCLLIERNAMI